MINKMLPIISLIALSVAIWLPCVAPKQVTKQDSQHHTLIIVGSGPAGLTAAIYAGRAKLQPLVIEGPLAGGVLTTAPIIENWPGQEQIDGAALMNSLRTHAQHVGAQLISEQVVDISLNKAPFTVTTIDGKKFTADALILATGTCPKKAHCPGEEEYWGRGVCSCALCDAPLYDTCPVVVLGGGMMALQNVLWLRKYASKITLINAGDALQGPKKMLNDVLQTKQLEIINNCTLQRIEGDADHVTNVIAFDITTQKNKTIACNGVFVSLGYEPCTTVVNGKLPLNEEGKIIVDQFGHTCIPGVFAAGSAATIPHSQAIICAASGSIAAIEAEKFLGHKPRKKSLWSCQKS